MSGDNSSIESSVLTRREFVGALAIVGFTPAFVAVHDSNAEPQALPRATPVVSFHHDQPYLDHTGAAEPYLPPRGLCSAQAIAELDEAIFRSRYCYT